MWFNRVLLGRRERRKNSRRMMRFRLHRFLVEVSFWAQWWSSCLAILFASLFLSPSLCCFWLIVAWYGVVSFFVCFAFWLSFWRQPFVFVFCSSLFIKLPGFIPKKKTIYEQKLSFLLPCTNFPYVTLVIYSEMFSLQKHQHMFLVYFVDQIVW